MYQYILFDLDGTLTDPKVGITTCVAHGLKYFGIHVDDLDSLCKFIGPPLKESFMKYYGLNEEDAETAIEKYRERFSVKGLFENVVYEGISQLLENIKADGRNIILATSKPVVYAEQILEHFDLRKYFDFVAGSELDGTRVKKGEVIAYALEKCNITELDKVLMIGDREHDIIGANECGVVSAGVLWGYGNREEFESNKAKYIVDSIEELQDVILAD